MSNYSHEGEKYSISPNIPIPSGGHIRVRSIKAIFITKILTLINRKSSDAI